MARIHRATVLLTLLASLGAAQAAPKKPAPGKPDAKDAKPAESRDVDLAAVGLPVMVEGRLVNYVFVKLKLTVAPKADLAKLKLKEAFFRDAIVRAGTRTPFVDAANFTRLDDAALTAAMMREAAAIAGPGQIVKVTVAKETPQKTSDLPLPGAKPPEEEIIP